MTTHDWNKINEENTLFGKEEEGQPIDQDLLNEDEGFEKEGE
jgi:hypothetical protein